LEVDIANSSAMSGLTASNIPAVCGVGAVTCTRNARKRAVQYQYHHTATANRWTERNLIPPTVKAAGMPRDVKESFRDRPRVFSSSHTTPELSFTLVLCSSIQEQPQPASVAQACSATVGEMSALPLLRHNQQQVPSQFMLLMQTVSSVENMFKVVIMLFQRITTELKGYESEEDRIMVITKNCIQTREENWPLGFIGCAGEG
jgi:hypothetical protein